MWAWTGPAELAWIVWAGWWLWRYHCARLTATSPLVIPVAPVATVVPEIHQSTSKAMLLNVTGVLDSVRTIYGSPPPVIATARARYLLVHGAPGPNLVYRAEP